MANDISNLLGKFGASANTYVEVDDAVQYEESPSEEVKKSVVPVTSKTGRIDAVSQVPVVREPQIVALPLAAVPVRKAPAHERVEPVMDDVRQAPDTSDALPVSSDVVPVVEPLVEPVVADVIPALRDTMPATPDAVSSLRSLLNEAALKRQERVRIHNEAASQQALLAAAKRATPAHVIVVVSPKGGVGKTTICAALATVLNRKGRVIAIDLDPQNALQYHLGVSSGAANTVEAERVAEGWAALLREGVAGTAVLPYGAIAQDATQALKLRNKASKNWLAGQLGRMNLGTDDIVILDTPTAQPSDLELALRVADQVLVVLAPDAGSFIALNHVDQTLKEHDGCRYIVNQFDESRTFCQDMLEVIKHHTGDKMIGVVSFDHTMSEGLAYGVNPFADGGDSLVLAEVEAISEILESCRTCLRAAV